ncbi:MAG: YitT family protein [Bacteroidales bacterium]|nr:YitT family protein [Bacteroidales bacterium]
MNTFTDALSKAVAYIKTWKFWKELIIMTLGMLVAAAAVYYFLVPSKLIIGTISGLSIVLVGIAEAAGVTIKLSTTILVINVILLIMAYFLVNKEFGAKTVYTALILGPLTDFWAKVAPWEKFAVDNAATGSMSVMGDPWFDLCCFVLLLSASQALMFSINASTGGLDILAKIVNKYLHFDIGASVSIAGAIICCTAFAINPFRMVIIGLIGTWINGLVVDYFTDTLNKRKRVCIISDRTDLIRQFIVNDLVRGCSLYEVKGGYSGEAQTEIQVILTKDEFSDLMAFLKRNQVKAFITAGNVSEIYGTWFKHHKLKTITTGVDAEK